MMCDRRLATHFDWWLAATILGMALLGILTIYSANALGGSAFRQSLYLRQMTWVGVGVVGLVAVCLVSYRPWGRFAYVMFGLSLAMLVLVLFIGKAGLGAHRWVRVGGLAFQPSEFAKLGLVLFLARYFDDHRETLHQARTMLLPGGLTALCMLLVLKQPDLGTALLLGFIALSLMLLLGLRWRRLVPFVVGGAAVAPLLWMVLKDYQRRRI